MKSRIISAIIMIIILAPIIYFGDKIFKIAVGILGILALKEIIDLKLSHKALPLFYQFICYITLTLLIFLEYDNIMSFDLPNIGLAFSLLSLLALSIFYNDLIISDCLFMIGSIFLIGISFHTIIMARYIGLYNFLFLISIFIFTDTFALFGGKLFGKHKLIPKVSPNKTIEGTIIGTIFGLIGSSVIYHFLINPINIKVIFGILLLSGIGQIGDLIFSKLKRENNIKDFGSLIPGHGGILDRLDSAIALMLGYMLLFNLF